MHLLCWLSTQDLQLEGGWKLSRSPSKNTSYVAFTMVTLSKALLNYLCRQACGYPVDFSEP